MNATIEEHSAPAYSPDTTSWINSIVRLGQQAVDNGEQLVVVAIARKMARLMEYHLNKSDELRVRFSFKKEAEHFPIITEHAIPFFLESYSASNDSNNSKLKIVIVDDLVVYGDTVETVSESIYAQTRIKPAIIAMASKKIDSDFKYAEMIGCKELNNDEIPSFTAKCSRDILSLKSSIDIEHTILKISLNEASINKLKDDLEKYLKNCFPSAIVYSVTHAIPEAGGSEEQSKDIAKSVTVCFTNDSENINNDFNKIRFFICDDGLRIVSYAPNIWIESDLDKETFEFLSPELNECWKIIKSRLDSLVFSPHSDVDSLTNYKLSQSFEQRKNLSRVVWSNYLCSFENILKYKSSIIDVIRSITEEEPEIEICEEALNLIIGYSLSGEILELLNKELLKTVYIPKKPYTKWMQEADKSVPLIPPSDKDKYFRRLIELVHLAPSVSTSLSLIFEYLRKEYGLINNRHREDKVKVGETFESLAKTLSSVYSSKELLSEVYKWIDERIDLGIVVPKYERFPISLGNYAWRRFFRAGEREDYFLDIALLAQWLKTKRIGDNQWEIEEKQCYNPRNCKWLKEQLVTYNDQYPNQVPLELFKEGRHRILDSKIVEDLSMSILRFYMDTLETLGYESMASEQDVESNAPGRTEITALFK